MESVSAVLSFSFILLVAIMYSLLFVGALYANNRIDPKKRIPIYALRFIIGGWILLTGLLGLSGFFLEFNSVPPRIAMAALFCLVVSIGFSLSPLAARWLRKIPQWSLIGAQVFRVFLEIQLYCLAMTPLLPKLMTFEGRNWDILIGLSAPVLAFYVRHLHRSQESSESDVESRVSGRTLIVAWNILGIGFLINTVVNGILSAPTPIQQIFADPPNTAFGFFPFVWVPTFLVPVAFLLHILSIRKAMKGL